MIELLTDFLWTELAADRADCDANPWRCTVTMPNNVLHLTMTATGRLHSHGYYVPLAANERLRVAYFAIRAYWAQRTERRLEVFRQFSSIISEK
jgi:hypothetical protein